MVEAMLDLAGVGAADGVVDLGSGDGRIVLAAAARGASATGYDHDAALVAASRASAAAAGVADRARFVEGDLFEADLADASVVTLYLLTPVNLAIRPRLQAQLRPGARVVSYCFHMGAWEPDAIRRIGRRSLYRWTLPAVTSKA